MSNNGYGLAAIQFRQSGEKTVQQDDTFSIFAQCNAEIGTETKKRFQGIMNKNNVTFELVITNLSQILILVLILCAIIKE